MIPIQHRFCHLLAWELAGEPTEQQFRLLVELYISHVFHMFKLVRGYRVEWN